MTPLSVTMGQAPTVLVVDDDSHVLDVLVGIIEAKGFRVFAAVNAVDAIRLLAQVHVDILLTDIVMPDFDGIELAKQAKRVHPNLTILFTTGYFSRASGAQPLGAVMFKPMRAREVEAMLDAAVGLGGSSLS
jgi:two-component system cell cycle response regulator CpdR